MMFKIFKVKGIYSWRWDSFEVYEEECVCEAYELNEALDRAIYYDKLLADYEHQRTRVELRHYIGDDYKLVDFGKEL